MAGRAVREAAGFTLVEVMVALAILATALVVMISVTAADVREVQRAQMLNIVTNLARSKMFDLEEELLREGFQQTEKERSGDFSDEGWKQIQWEAAVSVVELPNISNIGGSGTEGDEGSEASAQSPLGGMLSSFGLGGQLGGTEAAGAGLIQSQFTMIQEVLKQSIRKITLKVDWVGYGGDCAAGIRDRIEECFAQPGGCSDSNLQEESMRCERLVVDLYVTDPAAIQRVVGGGFGGGGATAETDDGSGSGGTGTATNGSGSGASGSTGTGRRTFPSGRGGLR